MDDSHVVWPSDEYKKEFWRRFEEARAKGEPFMQLPALSSELPKFPELPPLAGELIRRLQTIEAMPPHEIHQRYLLLCGLVMRATLTHQHPCSCKLCQVVENWLKGESSAEMMERVLKSP